MVQKSKNAVKAEVIGFGLLLVIIVIVIAVAYVGMSNLDQTQRRLVEEDFRVALDMMKIRNNLNHQRADMLDLLYATDKEIQVKNEREINERAQEILELITEIEEIFKTRSDNTEITGIAEVKLIIAAHRETRAKELEFLRQGQVDEARALDSGTQADRLETIRVMSEKRP